MCSMLIRYVFAGVLYIIASMTSSVSPAIDFNQVEERILALLNAGDFAGAEPVCRMLQAHAPGFDNVWFYLGAACHGQGKYEEALRAFQHATNLRPDHVDAWHALAAIFSATKLYPLALDAAEKALALSPDSPRSCTNVGIAWQQLRDFDRSIHYFQQALALDPQEKNAAINLVADLIRLKSMHKAKYACLEALKFHAQETALYNNLAESCIHLSEFEQALDACDKGLQTDSVNAHLHLKRGLVLAYLKRFDESHQALAWAQVLNPNAVREYFPQWFEINVHLNPDTEVALDARIIYINAIFKLQQQCDWRLRDDYVQTISSYILDAPLDEQAEAVSSLGFQMYTFPLPAQMRLAVMRRISDVTLSKAWSTGCAPFKHLATVKPKLRIGYLSPDFRQHACAVLTRKLYELHDKDAFEVYGYSLFNAQVEDDYRRDIEANCDVFLDVSTYNHVQLAERIFSDRIDILVDLAGYTMHSRTEVMAMRPAPVQMSYIGFVCTMGADFIDYAIVDHVVCSDGHLQDWHEQPLRLPGSLYMYDTRISNAPTQMQRHHYGLPPQGMVFCCLNDNYKIEPGIFDVWMNILKAVPDSVLWLLGSAGNTEENLKRMAMMSGVDPQRIVFAKRVPMAEHLARYQLADIFLDTHWCNAHTTALEALWQGLPVLTCIGEVASSRIAASFLFSLEMPELVTETFADYQALAIFYARNPQARRLMREKLESKRFAAPLFDMEATVRYIEVGYRLAWQRYQSGLPPQRIDVPAAPGYSQTTEANKGLH